MAALTPAERRARKRTACPFTSAAHRACGAPAGEPCTNAGGEPMPYVHAARVKADREAHPRGGGGRGAGRKPRAEVAGTVSVQVLITEAEAAQLDARRGARSRSEAGREAMERAGLIGG